MLESCEPNAVLISDGDNDTYPMWYCQHVEGIRPDVRLINSILANSSWMIQPLYRKVYESEPFRFSLAAKNYGGGQNEVVMVQNRIGQPVELSESLRFINSDNAATKISDHLGERYSYFPSNQVSLTIDKNRMRALPLPKRKSIPCPKTLHGNSKATVSVNRN